VALLAVGSLRSSTPARSGLSSSAWRVAVGVVGAVTLAHLTIPGRPATLCPLRAFTGIPCPICGGTTAAVHIGHADFADALELKQFAFHHQGRAQLGSDEREGFRLQRLLVHQVADDHRFGLPDPPRPAAGRSPTIHRNPTPVSRARLVSSACKRRGASDDDDK